jgi:cation:H+ antiporter
MLLVIGSLLGGLLLLTAGAEGLIRGAASLARRLGLSPLVIGLTVVAFGTSTPEFVVSLQGALDGRSALALGNVVGSNIGNIGLILGGAALITPLRVQAQIIRVDVPIMLVVSLVLAGVMWDGTVSRLEGVLLAVGIVAYTWMTIALARRDPSPAVQEEFDEGVPSQHPFWQDLLYVVGGLGFLVGGGQLLVLGAVTIAQQFGVSETVIGLTIVGIGTSLPELATSVLAAARGAGDIAVGNVVGSNLFNILGILGPVAIVRPLSVGTLGPVDIGAMIGFALLLLPLMRTQHILHRWEGALLLGLYGGYLLYLIL